MLNRAVLYTRVSTDKEEQNKSLEIQDKHYTDYCERNGYELIEKYIEIGSGTNVRERPEFIRMLEDAGLRYDRNNNGSDLFHTTEKESKFDCIIVKDASRFSRNAEIGQNAVNRLRDKNITIIFENANLKSTDSNAKLLISFLFEIAENESESMSKRIKFSKMHNANMKIYRPARLPYGYVWNDKKEIIKHEEQAEIVKEIYHRFVNEGSHILSKCLNERGIPTQRGNMWSGDKILRIIKNRIYTGDAVVNRSKKRNVTDTKRYKLPEEEHIIIPNAVPQIIEFVEWEEMNKILKKRVNSTTKKGKKPATNDIYHGKLYCQACGSRFVRHLGEKDKINYMCMNRRKGQGCMVRGISISNVNDVFNRVAVGVVDELSNHVGYSQLTKRIEEERANLDSRRNKLFEEINSLESENNDTLQAIKMQFKNGSQNVIDMLSKEIDDRSVQIERLESQRKKININSIIKLREQVEEKRVLIEGIRTNSKITHREKIDLLKSITVGDNEIEIIFNYPTFENEILEFNTIFPMSKMHLVTAHHFVERFRRNHKEAREYWEEIDQYNAAYNEHYSREREIYMTDKNVGKEAIEIEKLLDSTNN